MNIVAVELVNSGKQLNPGTYEIIPGAILFKCISLAFNISAHYVELQLVNNNAEWHLEHYDSIMRGRAGDINGEKTKSAVHFYRKDNRL